MNASERKLDASERNAKIKERFCGIDPSEIEVIPATVQEVTDITEQKLKVGAYVRVSTANDEQAGSFELQVNDFTERIQSNPNWEFAGIYSDEGISGTELSHRKGMLQLIEDAKSGKVQLILAKSIARFARNVIDCLSIIEALKKCGVGIRFDEEHIFTLDSAGNKTVKNENHTPKYFIEGHHPAIISPELMKFEDAVYRKFIKKGTVMGDEIVYETNFGVTLRSYGNIRTLRHFFGFKKVSADGTIGVVLGVWEVRDSKLFQPGIRKKHAEEDSTALETLNA